MSKRSREGVHMPGRKRPSAAGATMPGGGAKVAAGAEASAGEPAERPRRHESVTLPLGEGLRQAAGDLPPTSGSPGERRSVRCPSAPRLRAVREEGEMSTLPLGKDKRATWPYDDEEIDQLHLERLPDTDPPLPDGEVAPSPPPARDSAPSTSAPTHHQDPRLPPPFAGAESHPPPLRHKRPSLRSGIFAAVTEPPSHRRPQAPPLPPAQPQEGKDEGEAR